MILSLVPLTRYVVRYEVAHGRPYSKLEELLLKAINGPSPDEGHTFAELRTVFLVHDRLLTEALVTLIQEGWVAMEQPDAEIRYVVTEEGRRTISSGRRPSNLRVRTKHASIVRERLTGQLARANDLMIVTAKELRGSAGGPRTVRRQALTPRVMRTEINGGEAERLLPRSDERQEWVRWIDSVSRVSQDLHYLPIRVDLEGGQVLGLPYQWQHLTRLILTEVTTRAEELQVDAELQDELRRLMQERSARSTDRSARFTQRPSGDAQDTFATVDATCADIAITAQESADMFQDVLSKCADQVFLAVANLDSDRAVVVRDVLVRLLTAGVKVDLLWSCDEVAGVPKDIHSVLTAARAKAPPRGGPMLVLNPRPSDIAADLLLAATDEGPVAVAGSMFAAPGAPGHTLAVCARIASPTTLAALARLCAGWWETVEDEHAMLAAHRWKHYGERWADVGALPASAAPSAEPLECAHHPGTDCSGKIAIITSSAQQVVRTELMSGPGRRFLLCDGRVQADDLVAAFVESCDDQTGTLFQAFGGSDGWYFLRRKEPGKWSDDRRPDFTSPSASQQVTGTTSQWLFSSNSQDLSPALSIQLSGHIVTAAWERTSRAQSSD